MELYTVQFNNSERNHNHRMAVLNIIDSRVHTIYTVIDATHNIKLHIGQQPNAIMRVHNVYDYLVSYKAYRIFYFPTATWPNSIFFWVCSKSSKTRSKEMKMKLVNRIFDRR